MDMTVVKLRLIDPSEDRMCYISMSTRCALTHARWGDTSTLIVTVMRICKSIQLRKCCRLK